MGATVFRFSGMAIRRSICLLAALLSMFCFSAFAAASADTEAPLVVGNRSIMVFRATLGDLSPAERAEAARRHINEALATGGAGWTSISPVDNGILVKLDDKPMFMVTAGDTSGEGNETAESLANNASRVLQKVWAEAAEYRKPGINLFAILKTVAAFMLLAGVLAALNALSRRLQQFITRRLSGHFERLSRAGFASNFSGLLLGLVLRSSLIALWLLALLAVFISIAYALGQFAVTRPLGESMVGSLTRMLTGGFNAAAEAVPGLFVAVIIFLFARIATQVSRALFDGIAAGRLHLGTLDAHTAPATRQLVNAAIWLFALAMAYPYLPGSHTEAFKGLSVLLGIMVSIGASGLVGQIASGLILVFTRALLVGEYVRIQECEGTVTELGLCVTHLRTGTGEEIVLPNSLVISHVTRNFSRNVAGGGFVLDSTVTIGYDTPWRQVHAMLLEAARQIPGVRAAPAPFVVQTALSDFYVAYRLVVSIGAESRALRPQVLSALNAAIQDVFNQYGVQIMSPHYVDDPAGAKLVPPADWYKAPATPPEQGQGQAPAR